MPHSAVMGPFVDVFKRHFETEKGGGTPFNPRTHSLPQSATNVYHPKGDSGWQIIAVSPAYVTASAIIGEFVHKIGCCEDRNMNFYCWYQDCLGREFHAHIHVIVCPLHILNTFN